MEEALPHKLLKQLTLLKLLTRWHKCLHILQYGLIERLRGYKALEQKNGQSEMSD